MTDYKSLSISDLKAIMDYCEKLYHDLFFGKPDEIVSAREARYKTLSHLKEIRLAAESELQSRLGIKE